MKNKLKNYQQIVTIHNKKDIWNSLPHKLNAPTNEGDSHKGFRGQVKKEIKMKNKNLDFSAL